MPEVSVVVPVYKVEPYLRKCLDSILTQTFTDFELILVDDGSPDNCGAICDEYASMDSRVRVFHQENGGAGKARNAGLNAAVGKYIYFCDGDDYIEKELLTDAVQAMDGYDMVVFNRDDVDVDGCLVRCTTDYHVESDKWNDLEYRSRFLALDFFRWEIGSTVWCRLFRKEIIDQNMLRFPENVVIAEDICFIICYLLHSNSVRTIPGVYYHYVRHQGSTMAEQESVFNFDNNNEISKTIQYHLHQCPEQVILNSYCPIIHFSTMDNVISRAKRKHPSLGLKDIRSILLNEIKDTFFFLEQSRAFVRSKYLFIQKWDRGPINALMVLSEWSYYLNGNELIRMIINPMFWLYRAFKKLLRLVSCLARCALYNGAVKLDQGFKKESEHGIISKK